MDLIGLVAVCFSCSNDHLWIHWGQNPNEHTAPESGEKNLIKYEKYENCPKRETCIHKFDTRVAVKGFCFYLAKSSGNQHLSTKQMTYLSESSGINISGP